MAYIDTIPPARAEGRLDELYRAAERRAGKVFQILQVQSLNVPALSASVALYQAVMLGPSPLSRVEREAIAVTVSRANDCFY